MRRLVSRRVKLFGSSSFSGNFSFAFQLPLRCAHSLIWKYSSEACFLILFPSLLSVSFFHLPKQVMSWCFRWNCSCHLPIFTAFTYYFIPLEIKMRLISWVVFRLEVGKIIHVEFAIGRELRLNFPKDFKFLPKPPLIFFHMSKFHCQIEASFKTTVSIFLGTFFCLLLFIIASLKKSSIVSDIWKFRVFVIFR